MKDPICGMEVAEPPRIQAQRNSIVYGFCSESCRARFEQGQGPVVMSSEKPSVKGYFILAGVFAGMSAYAWLGPGSLMTDFMGAFFVVFGVFKLFDWNGFADAYQSYDLIARKSRVYARAYPIIQLAFGAAYLTRSLLPLVNGLVLAVMSVSALGVGRALLSKQKIRCACLGTKIQLPMSFISLVEDVTMVAMAAWALFNS